MFKREDLFRDTEPRIFSTNPKNPENGRTFVWAWTEWFERLEGESGAVSFTPVADSETQLRRWLIIQKCKDIIEIDDDFAHDVHDEFLEQVPLFPEAPETSSEEPFTEQNPNEDIEHY
jgi:hypothetical protein